jgi:hypothetical protein
VCREQRCKRVSRQARARKKPGKKKSEEQERRSVNNRKGAE